MGEVPEVREVTRERRPVPTMRCESNYTRGVRIYTSCRYPARWLRVWGGDRMRVCGYHARQFVASSLTRL